MKKILLPLFVAIIAIGISTSCKKTVKAIFPGAETDLPEFQHDLPAIPQAAVGFDLPISVDQPFNFDSIVRVNTGNNFGAGDITSVRIKQLKLRITSGFDSVNNLSNFQSASFKFSSNVTPTIAPVQVASITFDTTYSIEKIIPGDGTPELKPYLGGNILHYDIIAKVRRKTTKTLKISVIATMLMK